MQEQHPDMVKLIAGTQKRHIPLVYNFHPGLLAEDRQGVDTWLCDLLLGSDLSFTSRATSKASATSQAAA